MNLVSSLERQNFGRNLLSQLVAVRSYAETKSNGRKETHAENVERVIGMHTKRFGQFEDEIRDAFQYVHDLKVMPSMRNMQFAGYAIERSHARNYNCCATNITSHADFADILWLSMNGCGVGFSVQQRHISNLPVVTYGNPSETMLIPDSKEGWADSIKRLLANPRVRFDYSLIRLEGAPLSTGGTASGPKPLRDAHQLIRRILQNASGRKLTSTEVYDIICHQSDAVVVGGVRRAALICLFDAWDSEMLHAKSPQNFNPSPMMGPLKNAQRERSNNSAVILRSDPAAQQIIKAVMEACFDSPFGDPGIYVTNDYDMLVNPCVEIALLDGQCCNLSEINVAACRTAEEFYQAVQAATVIGTLQASLTSFNYIQPKWQRNCEAEALLGVSLTGQAENWGLIGNPEVLRRGAQIMLDTNARWARKIGVNLSARNGCTKPSGSASTYLRTTPGIHGAYDELFVRRMQMERGSPLARYLIDVFGEREPGSNHPIESHNKKEGLIVVGAPHAATNAIIASRESAVDLLNRAHHVKQHWILPSHRAGANSHNVSLTCYYKEDEKNQVIDWMCDHADTVSGVAFFPHFAPGPEMKSVMGHQQTPFESINTVQFNEWCDKFEGIQLDLSEVDFSQEADERTSEPACAGGACDVLMSTTP